MNSGFGFILWVITLGLYWFSVEAYEDTKAELNTAQAQIAEFKQRAVSEGAATWSLDNETGDTTFTWIGDLFTGPVESE